MSDSLIPKAPQGYQTINSFIITKGAEELIVFLTEVFNGKEMLDARTVDTDGLLLHSEIFIGDSMVMVADQKPDWPDTPSLLRVYVTDLEKTLSKAEELGATIVTKPTDFFGDTLARMTDKWGNLWWVYEHQEQEFTWDETEDGDDASWEPSEDLTYIHDSLIDAMRNLKSDK